MMLQKKDDLFDNEIYNTIAQNKEIKVLVAIREYLIKNGKEITAEDLKIKDNYDRTPLHFAAMYGSVLVAEYFIEELKAEKESMDILNRTPLFVAAEYSN